jgi:hypothetical protein
MLRPGRYESLSQIDMPNSPMKISPQKGVECFTADDLKDLSKKLLEEDEYGRCKLSDYRSTASQLSLTATCVEDGESYSMTMEMTFTTDSYTGLVKSLHKQYPMTMKTSGRRIGDCTK